MRLIKWVVIGLAGLILFTGCGASVGVGQTPTVESHCDHGNRVYVAWKSGTTGVAVVPHDPSCRLS